MKALERRLSDLEQRIAPSHPLVWHQIMVDGQSEDEAIADYEAANGAIGSDHGLFLIKVVDP